MKDLRYVSAILAWTCLLVGSEVQGESIYDFKADLNGTSVSLEKYRGQVLRLNYAGLRALYREYHDRGFNVIAFPCNQFGHEAPGSSQYERSEAIRKFGYNIDIFDKIHVNGFFAHPLYKYLKSKLRLPYPYRPRLFGQINGRVEWNYVKFVINREGKPAGRYLSFFDPLDFESLIVKLLNETAPSVPTT